VEEHLGATAANDNFRLWYTDRATHAGEDDPTEVVDYTTALFQVLLDLSAWVEKGIAPSKTSDYRIDDGQVMLADEGKTRGGLQPTVVATINGKQRADVKQGEKVTVHVVVDVPKGTGKVVKADWCLDDTKQFNTPVDFATVLLSADGEHAEFDATVSYDKSGTYFPTVKVYSERNGDASTTFTRIPNLGKVRVVVQ